MAWKRKVMGSVVAMIGYMLSPLSWWNDMFVNVPLALLFAWVVSFFYKPAFTASLVLGYWLTNVLGFVLLHKGAQQVLSSELKKYSRRDLLKDVLISLLYTLIIVALVKFGFLKPAQNYFTKPSQSLSKSAQERRVNRAHGLLCFGEINHDGHLDFTGGNHIDVDLFAGQSFEHFSGNTRMAFHTDSDNGQLPDVIGGDDFAETDFRLQVVDHFLRLEQVGFVDGK
jgi:hypothetical protein